MNEQQYRDHIQALEAAIVKADEQLEINEGIGLVTLLGKLPEAEIVKRVLEQSDGKIRS